LVVVLLVCVAAVGVSAYRAGFDINARMKFGAFKETFSKVYASDAEHEKRFVIFARNLEHIAKLNKRNDGATYGVTQFTDLTHEEFKEHYLMTNLPPLEKGGRVADLINATIPSSFNWATHSPAVVTPVYNQGQCGSCWAFSATENTESRWALAGHPLVSLAMQQIVSCDTTDYGCSGGWPYNAYAYVMRAGGMEPYSKYPYVAENEACMFKASEIVSKISRWEYVTQSRNEDQMRNYLVAHGPLSVCVDASSWSFYTGGTYPASSCSTSIDHCVLATGYDVGQGYWIIRNSWGTSWGISGYMHLQMNANACAVAQVVTSSVA